jgi:hypothetical protein
MNNPLQIVQWILVESLSQYPRRMMVYEECPIENGLSFAVQSKDLLVVFNPDRKSVDKILCKIIQKIRFLDVFFPLFLWTGQNWDS